MGRTQAQPFLPILPGFAQSLGDFPDFGLWRVQDHEMSGRFGAAASFWLSNIVVCRREVHQWCRNVRCAVLARPAATAWLPIIPKLRSAQSLGSQVDINIGTIPDAH
jgi:hypothetical protein